VSKLYTKYLEKKNINKDKCYLFECGMFYIFIDDDEIFNIEIVNNNDKDKDVINDKIVKMIKDIDIDNISPLKAIEILYKFKELLNE
jgi:DNA mismatch repair ATPase MutS